MSAPTVAAAIIARNELKFLPGCLESLQGLVDDVVIVDTGSSDGTQAVARSYGADLFEFEWIDDFAAARNRALSKVRADWILYIDADERLRTPGRRPIGDFLAPQTSAGAYVRFQPRPGYTFYREPRLFVNHPEIRFRGRIHETHRGDLSAFAERRNLSIPPTPVVIEHLGFEGDQSHKHARNLPLLVRETAEHPERPYCWHHLAETLAGLGRREDAIEACRRGLSISIEEPSRKEIVDRRQLGKTYARLLLDEGQVADDVIAELLEDLPEDWALLYLKARSDLAAGRHESALAIAERLKAIDPDELTDGFVAYDRRLFTDFAWDLTGAACLLSGRRRDAAAAYRKAACLAPEVVGYRAKAAALAMN